MNLSIKEAVKATGKGEATIRRLANKIESQPYIESKKGKIYIDANYLFSIYEARMDDQVDKTNDQLDKVKNDQVDQIKLLSKIDILEERLKMEKAISDEKDKRISDLQNAMKLLEYKKQEQVEPVKKKRWWHFIKNN